MAGIGFELQKMFKKKGVAALMKAYGYAGIVCVGPMILGILLLIGIRVLAFLGDASKHQAELINSMVTYTLLASLVLTNSVSLITTRYTADQLYMKEEKKVFPSFWGSVDLMIVAGGIAYGIFLYFSGIPYSYQFLCIIFYGEMILVWTEITYLTTIKDYKGILLTFAVSLLAAWICGSILLLFPMDRIVALMIAVCIGYGIMAIWYAYLLLQYFPEGDCSSLLFLEWHDRYPELFWIGFLVSMGMFGHIVIMWTSPLRVQVQGLFYGAPVYDIAAICAFLSILVTTICFVTSVEVNFYPKYRNYFSLINDGGSFIDVEQAEKEMKTILIQELSNVFLKQLFATILFMVIGTLFLPRIPLGVNEDILGIFRVLCIGYAFYALGNSVMLIQLYFSDNKGALISTITFSGISCVGTFLLRNQSIKLAGVGFLAGSFAYCIVSIILLWRYLRQILFHVLCNQPIVQMEVHGKLKDIANYWECRYQNKYLREEEEEEEGENIE